MGCMNERGASAGVIDATYNFHSLVNGGYTTGAGKLISTKGGRAKFNGDIDTMNYIVRALRI